MRKKRSRSSGEGLINLTFTIIYIGYWWFILQEIFKGESHFIYISIIPFIGLMFLHSLATKWHERRKEKQLVLSVEKSIARYKDRIRPGA
ncbi:hypothetical protein JMA_07770 [Jeotgalibacillus malaysiensis]|uniref:Uncharacterized protein n=1 Tax=Jeotgalibacillus malaysiensis TaxID=1508404 RepID=A0A0B5APT6_9BACL|nr:hypothetical protein [Jeotgalibacillus malaysiensis]AJD90094.1 hypothetical protein JMA_07770 [Jeotgalibacillus malaysiensis]